MWDACAEQARRPPLGTGGLVPSGGAEKLLYFQDINSESEVAQMGGKCIWRGMKEMKENLDLKAVDSGIYFLRCPDGQISPDALTTYRTSARVETRGFARAFRREDDL
jgi:hypothetical protein